MQDLTTPEGRRRAVQEWQRYYGMEPRNDSKLTDMFAEGHLPWSPDAVARGSSPLTSSEETVWGGHRGLHGGGVTHPPREWDLLETHMGHHALLRAHRAQASVPGARRCCDTGVRVTLSRAAPRLLPGWIQT